MSSVAEGLHLVRRFFGAIKPGAPAADDDQWARAQLGPGEIRLWESMNNPDRRHAVEVARLVHAELPDAGQPTLAAALLHDVGKVACGFRTPARVVATIVWSVLDDAKADSWIEGSGFTKRLGQYRRHPELGEAMLIEAGAHTLTSSWAADHHRPRDRWRADPAIGDVLKRCDDD